MNVIDFYNKVLESFPREKLSVGMFVNPTFNHHGFDGIQFVYPNGAICPPLNKDADTIIFANPLEGPFYRLPVIGVSISDNNYGGWWKIMVTAELPDGETTSSCGICIKEDKEKIVKEITNICGNIWWIKSSLISETKSELV